MSKELIDRYELTDAIEYYQETSQEDDVHEDDKKMDIQLSKWLSELSQKRSIQRIKDHDIHNDINTYTKMMLDALQHVFDIDKVDVTHNDGSVLIRTPISFIDFVNEDGFISCVVTLKDDAFNVAIANLIDVIKDIFKGEVVISDDTYIFDESTGDIIIGYDDIKQHRENSYGKKVSPFIYYGNFEDEELAHA